MAKKLVKGFNSKVLEQIPNNALLKSCEAFLSADHIYRGVMPFYEFCGVKRYFEDVVLPIKKAMTSLQKRTTIFFAGYSNLKPSDGLWVIQMGNFFGDFTKKWLGIEPTQKLTYLPFATCHKICDGHITETVEFLDILAVLTQANLNPYISKQTGSQIMHPGPATNDGILRGNKSSEETIATYDLTTKMLTELALTYTSPSDHLKRYWHPDMNWFGPTGIGSSLGMSGYLKGHTRPFEDKLKITKIHDWELAVAEGHYSAVMWLPCLTMKNSNGYMGVPKNDHLTEMRVIDLYRRKKDKLAENWIFIDMLHFLKLQNINLLS